MLVDAALGASVFNPTSLEEKCIKLCLKSLKLIPEILANVSTEASYFNSMYLHGLLT